MKAQILSIAALAASISFADTPSVGNVKMQQRYPWNGLVDIDYEISGEVDGVSVEFSVNDRQNNNTYKPTKFLSAPTVNVGKNRATWDTAAEGVNIISTNVIATVSLLKSVAPAPSSSLYMVIDISGGTTAESYPVSYLAAVPAGGWTDEYKTSKLVLRRIEKGSFMMGCDSSEVGYIGNEAEPHKVTISQPFYIGVFEVTQRQWELVMGTNPSYFINPSCYASRPVEQVSYDNIRGSSSDAGWPGSSAVDASSFMGKIRAKTGIGTFDLPTEAKWEFACRAGTATALNSGKNLASTSSDANMSEVGRYKHNGGQGYSSSCDNSAGSAKVGSYLPNAWGLYDMHGNVWEWTLDWWQDRGSFGSSAVVDPVGPSSGPARVPRGGSWLDDAYNCRAAYRIIYFTEYGLFNYGFRICCAAAE